MNTTTATPTATQQQRNRHSNNRRSSRARNNPIFLSFAQPGGTTATAATAANQVGEPSTPGLLVRRPLSLARRPISQSSTSRSTSVSAREQAETDQAEVERLQQELALMEAFFQTFLNGNGQQNGQFNPFVQAVQQEINPETANHPTSKRALRQIPNVTVTAEDLVDENNRECCICLDEIRLGARVSRLPCGHIFHGPCITDWLEKHNSCCICRYELETDNPEYERVRREKMKNRKPRFREYELKRMSIRELRDWCQKLKISQNAVEKSGLVDSIMNSGKIDLIAAPKPLEYKLSNLRNMTVSELKRVMNEAGVFFDPVNVVEKEDLVQIFINSGRLSPIPEPLLDDQDDGDKKIAHTKYPADIVTEQDHDVIMIYDSDDDGDNTAAAEQDEAFISVDSPFSALASASSFHTSAYENIPESHQPSLAARPISELKSFARELGIGINDCVEKTEIVERIAAAFADEGNDTYGHEPETSRRRRY